MARKTVAGIPGSDPTLSSASVTIHDRTYKLCFDFNALATAEELTGINLLTSLDLSSLSVVKFRAIFYAALLKDQPEITLGQAGSLITMKSMNDITLALIEAWTGSRPEVDEAETKANPHGESSSES